MGLTTPVQAGGDVRARETASMLPVYGQLPFVPVSGDGCDIVTDDGRRILDLYGGHAVAALGYGHPVLSGAISAQAETLVFQSNAVALDVRARAAEALIEVAPVGLDRVFFVNSGAEANENALRMAINATGRGKVLAIEHGFHGRTAAAGAVTWGSAKWYGFPSYPFAVEFIPRNDVAAARRMIGDDVAAVIFEPVQGVAGAFDLDAAFVAELRAGTARCGAMLIADEVQTGMGRSGDWFAVQRLDVTPDLLTVAKALGGGFPCAAVLCPSTIADAYGVGALGTTFGGGPLAAAAILAVIGTIRAERLLTNVLARERQVRASCCTGPVRSVSGLGLLLGLACDRPAVEVRDALLERDILVGTSSDPRVARILAPLTLEKRHVARLAAALADIPPVTP